MASQANPQTSNMATKLAPRNLAWRPSGLEVGVKSHAWLFGVRFCMPEVQHGARVSQKRTNMALRSKMFPYDLHYATSASMKFWALIPMDVARIYASWLMRKQQNRNNIRTVHGRRSFQAY